MIIDLEMQKGFNKNNTDRFLKYISHLDVNIDNEKIWIVALLINDIKNPRLNKSNHISYIQRMLRNYSELKIIDSHVVLQIDLNYCYRLIKEGKTITLTNQKLGNEGKEWIKFLTMSIWCEQKDNKELFYFPNLDEMIFYQEEVKNALTILSHQDPMYQIYVKEEENLKKELIEFNRLKENEKNHQNEIEKKIKQIAKKDEQLAKKVLLIAEKDKEIINLKKQINLLKNNNNSRKNSNGKRNVKNN